MDLTPYVDRVRRDLLAAAEAGGDEGRAIAERLAGPLDSTVRLTLLDALSTAVTEITRDLAPGSVDLRLRGLDPSFVVTSAPTDRWAAEQHGASAVPHGASAEQRGATTAPAPAVDDDGPTARINFRPPEHLKARIEDAAAREGLSVNAW